MCKAAFGTISTYMLLKLLSQIIKVHLDGFCEGINFLKSLFIISLHL